MSRFTDQIKETVYTGFWLGYSPVASGTVGTIPAVFVYILIKVFLAPEFQRLTILFFLALACVGCVALGDWAEKRNGKKDPGTFVLDEIAGFLRTVLFFSTPNLFLNVLWAFVATRFFDIIKPFPAYRAQDAPGGWGILLDGLFSSVYAIIFLKIVSWLFPWAFG
ncbi:MAG: phosphatidylglycerophosphatase A, partial [Deltaproteobacteria bacterium]|nr:phosphatidylglycerophosphatase A [Deltaproteobacteria bacterium]